jgi:hypothetical protein
MVPSCPVIHADSISMLGMVPKHSKSPSVSSELCPPAGVRHMHSKAVGNRAVPLSAQRSSPCRSPPQGTWRKAMGCQQAQPAAPGAACSPGRAAPRAHLSARRLQIRWQRRAPASAAAPHPPCTCAQWCCCVSKACTPARRTRPRQCSLMARLLGPAGGGISPAPAAHPLPALFCPARLAPAAVSQLATWAGPAGRSRSRVGLWALLPAGAWRDAPGCSAGAAAGAGAAGGEGGAVGVRWDGERGTGGLAALYSGCPWGCACCLGDAHACSARCCSA